MIQKQIVIRKAHILIVCLILAAGINGASGIRNLMGGNLWGLVGTLLFVVLMKEVYNIAGKLP